MPHLTWQWAPCFKDARTMCYCPKCMDARLKAWQEKHKLKENDDVLCRMAKEKKGT